MFESPLKLIEILFDCFCQNLTEHTGFTRPSSFNTKDRIRISKVIQNQAYPNRPEDIASSILAVRSYFEMKDSTIKEIRRTLLAMI